MKNWNFSLHRPKNKIAWIGRLLLVIIQLMAASAFAAFEPPAGRIEQIAAWLPEKSQGPGRPISDRSAWEALAARPEWNKIIKDAEKAMSSPIPILTDELYLDFSKTGNRDRYQAVYFLLRDRFTDMVLAECMENKGRFLPAIEECIDQLCDTPSWTLPAHDRSLTDFKGQEEVIDLGAAHWAWTLACGDYLLGEKLSPPVRQGLRQNMHKRIFDPIQGQLNGKLPLHWWFSTTNNWNAVCLANVTGAALAMLEDRRERAFYVAAAEYYIHNFLKGFTEDGYCSEGLGYWNYGYGSFLLLTETLLWETGGKINLLELPGALPPARFGSEIRITENISPAFADCGVNTQPSAFWLTWLSRYLKEPLIAKEADITEPKGTLYESMLFAFENSVSKLPAQNENYKGLAIRTWFDKAGILIERPGSAKDCRLAAALKGGHNDEHHNHNDVGSYVLVLDGRLILADPGAEVYTSRTFSDKRYESKVLNSFGHPVPVVAGKLQQEGRQAQAKILKTAFSDIEDCLIMDIASAYNVPSLKKLIRCFEYSRKNAGSLSVRDTVQFSEPQKFETAMITFEPIRKIDEKTLEIGQTGTAVRVEIQSTQPFEIRTEEIKENLSYKKIPTRIGITLTKPVKSADITLKILPI